MVKKTATAENSKVSNGKTSVKTGKLKKRKETSPQQKNVGDNEIKPLRYTLTENHSAERHLFLKRSLASSTSLIVANIPSFLDIDIVKLLITQFVPSSINSITNVRSSAVDGSLECGQISLTLELDSEKAVSTAIQKCEAVGPYRASNFGYTPPTSFLKRSLDKYKDIFMNAEELQDKIDIYMQHHDQQVLEAKRDAKRKYTEPDEEGWITVTKASKKVAKVVKLKKTDIPLTGGLNKKRKDDTGSFYSFQGRESKLKKANELREKFDEDRKRLEQLRKARSFKPY